MAQTLEVDVAVIGAGPAGMAAAARAKEAGASRVLLIERQEQLGGLLHQCIHNGFGLFYFGEDLTGPEYAHRFAERVMDLGVEVMLETMVTRLSPEREITAVSKEGVFRIRAKSVVLAMGCRERTRDQVQIPGSRPAGIFTAGTAQRMVNVEGLLPGRRIVILGSGDVGMIMARRLLLEGAEVLAVVEILPYVGGLIRNEVQCLHDFQVPLFLEHTVTKVHGERRVEAVTIARVDRSTREPLPGTERTIECDTLLLSVGLIPENELSRMAGVLLDPLTGGAVVDESRQSSVPGIFAGGNVLHVHDLVDNVSSEAEIAGEGAARFAQGIEEGGEGIAIRPGEGIRYVVPQRIRGRQPVTLYLRVKDMAEGVRVRVGDIWERKFRVVKPSEMLKVELSTDELSRIEGRELLVELER